MARSRNLVDRIHPLIPNIEQFSKDPSIVYSDHLPILAEIPFSNSPEPFKVITWNVYNPGTPFGFAPLNAPFYNPTVEESEAREKRNIAAVLKFIQNQAPDVIVFQEANYKLSFSADKIATELAKFGWKVDVGVGSVLTIYNANQFNKVEIPASLPSTAEYKGVLGHVKTALILKESKNEAGKPDIIINNLHLKHEDFPQRTEEFMTEMMANDTKQYGACSVIAGDFGTPFVPINADLHDNITTEAVPPSLREYEFQGADWSDGCFYRLPNENVIHQPGVIETLDPETGNIFKRPKIQKPSIFKDFTKTLAEFELIRPRPFLSLAIEHLATEGLDPSLKSELKNLKINLCKTSNALNEHGYCVSTTSKRAFAILKIFLKQAIGKNYEGYSIFSALNNNKDITITFTKKKFDDFQKALRMFASLGNTRLEIMVLAGDDFPLDKIQQLGDLAAENKLLAIRFNIVIENAMINYNSVLNNINQKKQASAFYTTMFTPSRAGGKLRATKVADAAQNQLVNGSLKEYLEILSSHLSDPKAALNDDSFTSFILRYIVIDPRVVHFLHLDDLKIKQLTKDNKKEEKKEESTKPSFDLDNKSDRKKLKELILERINGNLEIQKTLSDPANIKKEFKSQ